MDVLLSLTKIIYTHTVPRHIPRGSNIKSTMSKFLLASDRVYSLLDDNVANYTNKRCEIKNTIVIIRQEFTQTWKGNSKHIAENAR